jgi:hypothetical protein
MRITIANVTGDINRKEIRDADANEVAQTETDAEDQRRRRRREDVARRSPTLARGVPSPLGYTRIVSSENATREPSAEANTSGESVACRIDREESVVVGQAVPGRGFPGIAVGPTQRPEG